VKKKRSKGMQPEPLASGFGTELRRTVRHAGLAACLAATSGLMLSACDAGSGGDNGRTPAEQQAIEDGPMGLVFSYPYNGQQNVTLTSQIAFRTQSAFENDIADAIVLRTASGEIAPDLSINVVQDDNQPNVYRVQTSRPLRGNVTYRLVTTRALQSGDVRYDAGQTLFQFTTAPTPGGPSDGEFRVTEVAPGETNPVTGRTSIFAQFNTLHISLSETIDPSSIVDGETFTVTGPDGDDVDGALIVSGHEIAFDPADNLAPGDYTISLSGDVRSAFGKSLEPMSVTRTVLDSGEIVQQNLLVDNDQGFAGDADDSPLDGLMDNLITIRTQLIGVNQQPARNKPTRGGVLTNLSQPGMPGFGDVFPNSIPAGQIIELKPLSVSLNGDVPTPLQSGPIQVQFGTDANVYLMANDYQDIATPTAVRLRFDLNNTTLISAAPGTPEYVVQALANGVFNQSALNIQASGLAIPQDNGDLVISTLGTFPLTVNRSDDLTIDFSLTLRLPASEQDPVQADTIAPFIIAQSPSACLYTFGTPAYRPLYEQRGSAPTVLPEQACVQVLQQGGALSTPSGINDFQIEASPALTFSEPLDPLSVNRQSIQITGPAGNVPVSFQLDGSSVVLRPDDLLQPDTQYTITLGSGSALRDLGGNALVANPAGGPGQSIRFTTEPLVDNDAREAPVILGELTPGVPCALEGGNFMSGGNTAGRCVGSDSSDTTATQDDDADSMDGGMVTADYPVFQNPKNVSINLSFSKFVQRDTVVLADGCLTQGSGDGNSNGDATLALERIDASGQCIGTPEASLAFLNTNDETTRGVTIRPVEELEEGARYWIVVCGNDSDSSCGATVLDTDGLALNTDPYTGTGTTPASPDEQAAGGPDIIMPFDAIGYTTDFYADQFTLPYTDTNGNGQFDDASGNGVYDDGDERPQPSNRTLVDLSLAGSQIANSDDIGMANGGAFPAYLSLTRPVAIRKTVGNCGARLDSIVNDDGENAVGDVPDDCIQVSLLPGGFSALTGIGISGPEAASAITGTLTDLVNDGVVGLTTPLQQIPLVGPLLDGVNGTLGDLLDETSGLLDEVLGGLAEGLIPVNGDPINTGQLLLRFPNDTDDGAAMDSAQSGYIVPRCEGTLNGQDYEYEPCFTASLNLVANAPDAQGLTLSQQRIVVNVVGPVAFEQNGRLVISLNNVNTFSLQATALGLLPASAEIRPGRLNFQLTGNEIHGGRAFPER